jgi:hypothetical protein
VKHHTHFLGEELVDVVHKESLRECHLLRHSSEIVLIIVVFFLDPLGTLPD